MGTTCPFPLGWNRVNWSEKNLPHPLAPGSYSPECNTVRQQFSNRFGSLKPFRQRHCFDIQIRPLLFLPYNVANWIINFLKSCIILKINGLHCNLKQINFRKKNVSPFDLQINDNYFVINIPVQDWICSVRWEFFSAFCPQFILKSMSYLKQRVNNKCRLSI